MTSEQARGNSVDKRADIWAFGVVLYEMLTGRRLFGGENLTDIIASVVKGEPDWDALPLDTPRHIRRLLELCLRKDPKLRLRDIGDARLVLDETEPPPAVAQRQRAWLSLIVVTIVVASATAAIMRWFRAQPVDLMAARFEISFPEGTIEPAVRVQPQPVPSPDGRYLASLRAATLKEYLWVRPLGSLSAQRLDSSVGANAPFWSPDGKFIGFFTNQKLKKVAVSGGSAQSICDTGPGWMEGGTWNQSGTIVFVSSESGGPLMRVLAEGGPVTPATTLDRDRGEVSHSWPQFLPDGKHFIYLALSADPEKSGTYIQELGAPRKELVLEHVTTRAAFAPPGYLLFAREATLNAQRLDLKKFQVQGAPIRIAEEVTMYSIGRTSFSASANGVLAYRREPVRERQLTWYDRRGNRLNVVGKPAEYIIMRMSPDEKHVALQRKTGAGAEDTWIMDLGSGISIPKISNLKQTYYGPVWSPDSQKIVVSLQGGGLKEIVLSSGATTDLSSGPNSISANDWSRNGNLISSSEPPTQVLLLPMGPEGPGSLRKLRVVYDKPDYKYGLRVSPDGQWVAYTSNLSGEYEVYVASFPSFTGRERVSESGGLNPVWRQNGKELFFPTRDGMVMAAQVKTGSKLEFGIPKELFRIKVVGFGQFAVSGDGQRFLVNEVVAPSAAGQLIVVLNWAAGLKQ